MRTPTMQTLAAETRFDAVVRPAWLHVVHSTDIDEHAASQPQWSLLYNQISGGSFSGTVTHAQLPGLRMVLERSSCAVRQRGHIGQNSFGFAMALEPCGEAFFNGQRLDDETMMIGRGDELDLATPATFSMVGIVVDRELLAPLWERMYQKPLPAWLDRQVVVQARPGMAELLRAGQLAMLERIAEAPALLDDPLAVQQMRDAVLFDWIEAIPARVDTTGLKSSEARKRVVDRACDLMMSQPDCPLSILELCSRVGASPRKLEYCFRDVLGISPTKYLRAVRLNGARRDLKRGGPACSGVNDVAARWGFWHLSQFSLDYKRQFGELPSQTLRGARGN